MAFEKHDKRDIDRSEEMVSIQTVLITQLESCLKETHWFASAEYALKSITLEEATWRDQGFTNSIIDILNHLHYWNSHAYSKFTNKIEHDQNYTNEETFFKKEVIQSDQELQEKIESFQHLMLQWKERLKESDNATLMKEAFPGTAWWEHISNMLLHTAHHLGQIIYLRKKQGTWNPVKWN